MSRCFFHDHVPDGLRVCDGKVQSHHCLKQQTIKRLFPRTSLRSTDEEIRENRALLARALKDSRNLLPACKRHHDLWHAGRLDVPREAVPEAVEAFAEDYGLAYELDRMFGPREEAA